MSDRDRRRWTDNALDMLKQQLDSNAEEIADLRAEMRAVARLPPEVAAFRREFDEWKTERREDIQEFRTDIAELQRENKLAHKRIAHGRDPETDERLPPQPARMTWGDVVKVATAVGLVVTPVAAIVAALLTHGGAG